MHARLACPSQPPAPAPAARSALAGCNLARSQIYMAAIVLIKNAMARLGAKWVDDLGMERAFGRSCATAPAAAVRARTYSAPYRNTPLARAAAPPAARRPITALAPCCAPPPAPCCPSSKPRKRKDRRQVRWLRACPGLGGRLPGAPRGLRGALLGPLRALPAPPLRAGADGFCAVHGCGAEPRRPDPCYHARRSARATARRARRCARTRSWARPTASWSRATIRRASCWRRRSTILRPTTRLGGS